MIGVIDYRAGNAPSVGYALDRVGLGHQLVATPDELARADRLILPGVGAARATLASLRDAGLLEAMTERVRADGVPLLGICIGLQILLEHSEEDDVECLGWIPGTVTRFPDSVRVPQIGWNEVRAVGVHPVTAGLTGLTVPAHCYFVNSFFARPAEEHDVLATTRYGTEFCSVLGRGNIVATQFHAEKSGPIGLDLLGRFARWEPSC